MKNIVKGLLLAAFMLQAYAVFCQNKKTSVPQFTRTVNALNEININDRAEVSRTADEYAILDEAITASIKQLIAKLQNGEKLIKEKEQQYLASGNLKQGTLYTTILPMIGEMPMPVSDLPAAKTAMQAGFENNVFSKYIDKMEAKSKQLQDAAQRSIPAELKDKDKMEAEARRQAKEAEESVAANPLIQQMGGIEKLKNMTPEQRAAMGKQMAAKMKQDPHSMISKNDPRQLFTQKLMLDPSYAARFKHMNQQQQIEEYNAFLKENGFSPDNSGKKEDNSARVNIAMDIDKRIGDITSHIQEMTDIVATLQKQNDDFFKELMENTNKQFAKYVESLPMVEHGEAGKSKDTYNAEVAYQIVLLPIHAKMAIANKEIFKRYVQILKVTLSEYNEIIDKFWGKNKETDLIMAQRSLTPDAVSYGICNQLISLCKQARSMTNDNAGWQKSYNGKVLHQYD